jgi:hypothetical protein
MILNIWLLDLQYPYISMKQNPQDPELLKRKYRVTFSFNELEFGTFKAYCKKYKVQNRAKFMREAIVTTILKKMDEDYPSLFDEHELNRLNSK